MNESLVVGVLVGVALLFAMVVFNSLIGRKNRVSFSYAGIDAMLKKRYDLIPNLVSSVDRYMKHERELLSSLTNMRARAASGTLSTDETVALDNQVGKTLRTLFAQAENYPDLKASDTFLHLQASLNEVEEQVSASRRAYNAAVTDYNNGCEMFPLNIAAKMMGYQQKPWFEAAEIERESIKMGGMWS